MKRMKNILALILILMFPVLLQALLQLPTIVSDNMVLQSNAVLNSKEKQNPTAVLRFLPEESFCLYQR